MKNPSRNRPSQRKTGRKPKENARENTGSGSKKMHLRSRGMKGAAADAPKRAAGMRSHGATSAPRSPKKRRPSRSGAQHEGGSGWIYGSHACLAALSNPRRTIHELLVTESAANRLNLPTGGVVPQIVDPQHIDRKLPRGTVHQGIALKAAPLEWPALEVLAEAAPEDGLILVLDQITDPHNVGAMLRLSSAFGVSALVMQTRKAPPLAGSLAKVAVGCLETVPVCLETNIANTLLNLQRIGWQVTGLAGETHLELADALHPGTKQVIVMGAEGPGLRDRVRKTCDQLARIPMYSGAVAGEAESLNVATAAGIALYEARRG